jgi:hypothetical protein
LTELFPVFERECDWQKFSSVVAKYQRDWEPFSGCGRKMVKVFVADRTSTKASSHASRHDHSESDADSDLTKGIEACTASWQAQMPCTSAAVVSVGKVPHGEITPPTRGRSPLGVGTPRETQQTSPLIDLLVAAGPLGPTSSVVPMVPAGMAGDTIRLGRALGIQEARAVAPDQGAATRATKLSVADLLAPAPSAVCGLAPAGQYSFLNVLKRPYSVLGSSGLDDEISTSAARPGKALKKKRICLRDQRADDPLHLLLDALTKQI